MPWVISLTLLIPLLLPSFCPFFPSLINVDWLLTLYPGAQSGSWNTASSCAICYRHWEAVYETVTKHPRNAEVKSQLWQSSVPEGRELSSLAFAEWEGSPLYNWGICARNWKPSKELKCLYQVWGNAGGSVLGPTLTGLANLKASHYPNQV